ncbi:SAV_2336 N-terminal domain-related protein [Kitasatospora sp. NPDC001664]
MTDRDPADRTGVPAPPDPHEALREALAGLLGRAVDGTSGSLPLPQDVADVLWIARLTGIAPAPSDGVAERDDTPDRGGAPAPPEPPEPEPVAGPAGPEAPSGARRTELHPRPVAGAAGSDGTRGAEVVQVTRPPALPGALDLARALRPLRRPLRDPSGRVERTGLDEEATADSSADLGFLLPVWRSERQRRFSVDLLVDAGSTMAIWHGLAGELAALLERHGAFDDVRCWSLSTDHPVPRLTPFRRTVRHTRTTVRPAVPDPRWARPLADPLGRRILLVLTDGVGPAWYGEELPGFLARNVSRRPAAVLQVLPRRLWHRTALRPKSVEARSGSQGSSVPAIRSDAALPGIPRGQRGGAARAAVRWLPVLEVDAEWLAPWAEVVAGRTSGWTPMLAAPVRGVPRPRPPVRSDPTPATASEQVAQFRAGSSPDAYRLACHLAAAPLSLPVMRLVQRATLPGSGQPELAELFLSGLLEVRTDAPDPDEVVYDFRDGVREELLAELTRTESVQVLEGVLAKVSGQVAATFGGTLDFRALAASAGADGLPLPSRSRPFAEVAVAVLAGAGGQHAALARKLGTAVATVQVDSGPPAPGPAPLVHDTGLVSHRPRELALLVRACDPESASLKDRHSTVVVEAAPRTGKSSLLREYVHRHGARHSLVHWIDGSSVESLATGFESLRSTLGRPGLPTRSVGQILRRRPGWLVVIDDLVHDDALAGIAGGFGLADPGPGCLLVATPSLRGTRLPEGTVIIGLDKSVEDATADAGAAAGPEAQVHRVRSHRLDVRAVALATISGPDGTSRLAVCDRNGVVSLRDPAHGSVVGPVVPLWLDTDVVTMGGRLRSDRSLVLHVLGGDGLLYRSTGTNTTRTRLRTGRPRRPSALGHLTHVDGSPFLWTLDEDGGMDLRDPATAALVRTLPRLPFPDVQTATAVTRADGSSDLIVVDTAGRVFRCELDGTGRLLLGVTSPDSVWTVAGLTSSRQGYTFASLDRRGEYLHIWSVPVPPVEEEPPTRVIADRYRLVREIGKGSAGRVWEAVDQRDGSVVAVKVSHRTAAWYQTGRASDFVRQARALRTLRHPGLTAVLDAGVQEDTAYLAMELVGGPDLHAALAAGRMPLERAVEVGRDVAAALEHLHDHGLVHRDVKPANILFRPTGEAVLCDFGVGWEDRPDYDEREDVHLTWKGTTPHYMAPEQALGRTEGPALDLYSLGCVLYEMLTGAPPFSGRSAWDVMARHTSSPPTSPREAAPEVPEALAQLVLDLLEKDPSRRPRTAGEVAERLAALPVVTRRPTESALNFSLLGPVQAWRGGEPVKLGSRRQLAVLTILLMNLKHPLTTEELVAALWEEPHPPDAASLLTTDLESLREVLNTGAGAPDVLLPAAGGLHRLRIPEESVDVVRFERWLDRADQDFRDGDLPGARRHARNALTLWNGTPFSGAFGHWVRGYRAQLEERRVRAQELVTGSPPDEVDADSREGLRFSVLGPLKAWHHDEPLSLGSPQQQAVLAALLVNSGRAVTTRALVDGLWGDRPPPQAVAALRTYVSRLRAILEPFRRPGEPSRLLKSVSDGYALLVSGDLEEFGTLMERARQAGRTGDPQRAHQLLQSALSLWKGTPLAGVPGPYAEMMRAELLERQVDANELLFETSLDLGWHEEIVPELSRLAAAHPQRERLCALQMLALDRCGRSPEALSVYRATRRLLVEELGIEPGPELTALYHRIDAHDRDLRSGSVDGLLERLSSVEPVPPPAYDGLPDVLDALDLPPDSDPTSHGLAFGVGPGLTPVSVDPETDPLFVVFGESGAGKSALLRLLIRRITERYTPEQAGIVVGDFRRSLLGAVPPEYLVEYAAAAPAMASVVELLRGACASRAPGPDVTREQLRDRSWYTGKDMFVIVDDYDLVATSSGNPMAPLAEFLPFARDLGLRVIIARHSGGAGRSLYEPFMQRMRDFGAGGVLLSGDEREGQLLGTAKARPLPPGRGTFVTRRNPGGVLVQTAWLSPDAEGSAVERPDG